MLYSWDAKTGLHVHYGEVSTILLLHIIISLKFLAVRSMYITPS